MKASDKIEFDAPLKEAFELDRMSYIRQIQILIECIQAMIKSSSIVCDNAHRLENDNKRITIQMQTMKRSHSTELHEIKDNFEQRRIELEERVARDYDRLKSFKLQADSEIKVKDALIQKLSARNEELEESLKKAVTIMQNPNAMKEAFIKYNLDKVVYARSPSPNIEAKRTSPMGGLNTSSEVLTGSRKGNTLTEAIYVKNQQSDISQDIMKGENTRQSKSSGNSRQVKLSGADQLSRGNFGGDEKSRQSKAVKSASLRISQRFEGQTMDQMVTTFSQAGI